ncbi:MAG: YabP/YqfC family sporulation protein [Oscillospiraceae bacterium]|nr:YabP/YqfC family sporulation protein [Oscillospiraceae bacterium]
MAKRNQERENKKNAAGRLAEFLAVPQAAISAESHIEIRGNKEAIIEGAQGVLEYCDETIKISLDRKAVKFSGRSLNLKGMDGDSIIIDGFILSIEFT